MQTATCVNCAMDIEFHKGQWFHTISPNEHASVSNYPTGNNEECLWPAPRKMVKNISKRKRMPKYFSWVIKEDD